ncbi:MAG: methyltransferase domain-containing protein [Alphaproteobacteria bacterium]|nr:methyltransferase domain-containing protein [Alphaproteobacteria bacterium]MCB9984180.1 methyltransferase domain-containing protein [Micavibrio sp.]HPQ50298.1 hypothetical protein [Alphaproteobacteria bacterium]
MVIYLVALLVLTIIILFMLNFEYYRHKLGVSTSHSSDSMRQAILDEILDSAPQNTKLKIVDPGCGSGDLVLKIAKSIPDATVVGLELSPIPFWQAVLKKKISGQKNTIFLRENFFEYDFSDAQVIVTFLPVPVLHKLAPKLKSDMKSGALLLSNAFQMPEDWISYKQEMVQPILKRYLYCYKA